MRGLIWRCHHFTNVYQKSRSYDVCFLRYWMRQTNLLSFWVMFCPLPHYWPENLKIWEIEKMPGRIISLHLCIAIDDHMIYGSRDAEHYRHSFLSFWTVIYLLTTRKNKNFEKMKKFPGEIIILHMSAINENHMMCSSWDREDDTEFFVIMGHFLSF